MRHREIQGLFSFIGYDVDSGVGRPPEVLAEKLIYDIGQNNLLFHVYITREMETVIYSWKTKTWYYPNSPDFLKIIKASEERIMPDEKLQKPAKERQTWELDHIPDNPRHINPVVQTSQLRVEDMVRAYTSDGLLYPQSNPLHVWREVTTVHHELEGNYIILSGIHKSSWATVDRSYWEIKNRVPND